jgi:1-acyl-sn-glycerol-3-phosphate acyltransferase
VGGTKRRKEPKGRARPRRPALGNDPFERGAASREPAAPRAKEQTPTAAAASTAASTPTSTPTPTPTPTRTPTPTAGAAAAKTPPPAGPAAAILESAAARVAAVDRRVDAALDGVEARLQELAARSGIPSAPGELREAIARLLPAVKRRLAQGLDLLKLLEPAERLDRFGMDSRFAERLDALVEVLCSVWWRVAVLEAARLPSTGPAIVVANHAGAVPWDAFVLRHVVRRDHPARRDLRPLLDDAECDLPVIGAAAIRYGALRASPDAAHAVLGAGDVVSVFPEGSAVARKPWRDRYRIQHFGRGGFVKVAIRARAPIVPCAIIGSEEAAPAISRAGWLADRLGIPLVPGTSSLRFARAALLPLPSRWTLRFGEPVPVSDLAAGAADDPAAVAAIADRVRTALQSMLDEGVAARPSVFL